MPKNEFLPFGIEPGSNVLAPDAYDVLAARKQGFISGVAKSEELNTVWRQASVIATTIAQFIAEKTGQDVLDNGDLDALLTQLNEALSLPDGTTEQKGIVQLSSATDSDDETMAATPKAVKSVADKAGTVKSVNEHDPDENGNVKLGSAADANVTTSASDPTAGRVLKVGDGGLLGMALPVTDANLTNKDGLVSMMFNQGGGSSSIHFGGYGCGVHLLYGNSGDGTQTLSANLFVDASGNLSVEWLAVKKSDGSIVSQHTQKLWGPLNKATAADIGAMPYYGTALSVDLNTLGAYSAAGVHYQPSNAGATTANHYPIVEAGTLLITPSAYGCQQEYTTFGDGVKFVRGLSGPWNGTNGPWGEWKEIPTLAIADARYLQTLTLSNTGAVGTLALLCHDTALGLGATAAGSSLYYSGFGAQKDSYGDHATVGRLTSPQPAGTWKCLGVVPPPATNDRGASLFCRIA